MGNRLADFVEFLNSTGIPPATLHVVGFSLGAEAAGFAGKALKARGLRLGRITGNFFQAHVLAFRDITKNSRAA